MFSKILKRKMDEIETEKTKYAQGIIKLDEAKIMVDRMQGELEELKPVLEKKTRQVEKTMRTLDKETKIVQQKKEIVNQEAATVMEQKTIAEGFQKECSEKLAIALPHFEKAVKALRTLKDSDFVIMKSFANPPLGVKLALEACCIMIGEKPKMVTVEGQAGKK